MRSLHPCNHDYMTMHDSDSDYEDNMMQDSATLASISTTSSSSVSSSFVPKLFTGEMGLAFKGHQHIEFGEDMNDPGLEQEDQFVVEGPIALGRGTSAPVIASHYTLDWDNKPILTSHDDADNFSIIGSFSSSNNNNNSSSSNVIPICPLSPQPQFPSMEICTEDLYQPEEEQPSQSPTSLAMRRTRSLFSPANRTRLESAMLTYPNPPDNTRREDTPRRVNIRRQRRTERCHAGPLPVFSGVPAKAPKPSAL